MLLCVPRPKNYQQFYNNKEKKKKIRVKFGGGGCRGGGGNKIKQKKNYIRQYSNSISIMHNVVFFFVLFIDLVSFFSLFFF